MLIYKLVENNVAFAGEQFSENLRFNSEVLTDVLYDNIYKLLQDKFEEDDFVQWVADQLVEGGHVTKKQGDGGGENREVVVHEIDTSEYDNLV